MSEPARPPPNTTSHLLVCSFVSALLASGLTVGVGLARGDASLSTLMQRALVSGGLAVIGTVLILVALSGPGPEPHASNEQREQKPPAKP